MEIEKKFLVSDIPDLSQAVKVFEIEQGYLCSEPTVRIRRKNDDYILTYKNRIAVDDEALNVSDEREMPLTKDSFFHLKQKCDGICIKKTRYCIPYQNWISFMTVMKVLFWQKWSLTLLKKVNCLKNRHGF